MFGIHVAIITPVMDNLHFFVDNCATAKIITEFCLTPAHFNAFIIPYTTMCGEGIMRLFKTQKNICHRPTF